MKVFVFYNCRTAPTKTTYLNYLYSFRNYSTNDVYYQNLYYDQSMDFFNRVQPDLVIFYLIVFWNGDDYGQKIASLRKAQFGKAVKVAFFQDEYSRTLYSVKLINELGISRLYTVAPKSEWGKIYRGIRKKTAIKQVLTTYIDDRDIRAANHVPNRKRDVDISYRTALDSPYHVGRFGLLKKEIGRVVNDKAVKYRLHTDISTSERTMKFGSSWFEFLLNSKYVLGMESGASLHDRDGSIFMKVKDYLKKKPGASFNEVENECFPGMDGNLKLKAISPRHFESCLARTCQILIEGEYNGILKPWIHYLPLKNDLSNVEEILKIVKEDKMRKRIVDTAYRDITKDDKYTYAKFIPEFYSSVAKIIPPTSKSNYINMLLSRIFDAWTWLVAYLVPRDHNLAIVAMKLYTRAKKLMRV